MIMKNYFKTLSERINEERAETESKEIIKCVARNDGTSAIFIGRCPIFEVRKETDLANYEVGIEDVPNILQGLRNKYKKEESKKNEKETERRSIDVCN